MKKIFVILGLANILAMVLIVLYYIDTLNPAIDNRIVINFIDNKVKANIPAFILNSSFYKSIMKFRNDIIQINRAYLFYIWVFYLLVNIVTFVRILKPTVKDYFCCVLRLVFSPVTALIGFYINSNKNGKHAVMYDNNNQGVQANNYNAPVYNQPVGVNNYNEAQAEPIVSNNNTEKNNYTYNDQRNTQSASVRLVLPNKPIILVVISTIFSIAFLSGFVAVFFYIKKQVDKHASELPGISFFLIFIGIILGTIIFIGLPMGVRYFYKTRYLERCYRAIKEGTSFDDAKPIFKYFKKYTNISSDGANRIRVIIKVKENRFRNTDYEARYFEYVNGILVDKDQAYRRTTMTYR